MTIDEFGALTGKTRRQVQYLYQHSRGGVFTVPGHGTYKARKMGRGPRAKINIQPYDGAVLEQEENPVEVQDPMAGAKLAKMQVEIDLKRQQLKETREADEAAFQAAALAKLRQVLLPLKEAFRQCELNERQAELINAALTECLTRLEQP